MDGGSIELRAGGPGGRYEEWYFNSSPKVSWYAFALSSEGHKRKLDNEIADILIPSYSFGRLEMVKLDRIAVDTFLAHS